MPVCTFRAAEPWQSSGTATQVVLSGWTAGKLLRLYTLGGISVSHNKEGRVHIQTVRRVDLRNAVLQEGTRGARHKLCEAYYRKHAEQAHPERWVAQNWQGLGALWDLLLLGWWSGSVVQVVIDDIVEYLLSNVWGRGVAPCGALASMCESLGSSPSTTKQQQNHSKLSIFVWFSHCVWCCHRRFI